MIRRALVQAALPLMVPLAAAWVGHQERRILAQGVPLNDDQLAAARALGVVDPRRVRLLCLPRIPLPTNRLIRQIGLWTGTLSTETVGMAMRYGIFLRIPYHHGRRLLAHELTHTRQYEQLGGIRPFLRRYLAECLVDGYYASAMEAEANQAADGLCG